MCHQKGNEMLLILKHGLENGILFQRYYSVEKYISEWNMVDTLDQGKVVCY
jgi:hypothetical protein